MTSFQVKVLQKKFTLLHAHFSKIVLKYSNEVHLLRYLTPLGIILHVLSYFLLKTCNFPRANGAERRLPGERVLFPPGYLDTGEISNH
jgi:hypothetical protein